jgi:hypothetical protein
VCGVQANTLINEVDDKDLTIKYQACYARIADSKRRFLDAAMKYYELSQASSAASCAPLLARVSSTSEVVCVERLVSVWR